MSDKIRHRAAVLRGNRYKGSKMSDIQVLDRSAIKQLADGLTGDVLLPEDADYETARRVHNGLIDKRPAVIARCATTEDVASAVRFATMALTTTSSRGFASR